SIAKTKLQRTRCHLWRRAGEVMMISKRISKKLRYYALRHISRASSRRAPKAVLFFASLLLSMSVFQGKLEAAWGSLFCDIVNGQASGVEKAVDLYNNLDPDIRACTMAIRFMNQETINIADGFTITAAPPPGETYGVSIRRCVPGV